EGAHRGGGEAEAFDPVGLIDGEEKRLPHSRGRYPKQTESQPSRVQSKEAKVVARLDLAAHAPQARFFREPSDEQQQAPFGKRSWGDGRRDAGWFSFCHRLALRKAEL